jgi:hypothetical protein
LVPDALLLFLRRAAQVRHGGLSNVDLMHACFPIYASAPSVMLISRGWRGLRTSERPLPQGRGELHFLLH